MRKVIIKVALAFIVTILYLLLVVNISYAGDTIGEIGTEITNAEISNVLISPNTNNMSGNTNANALGIFSDIGNMKPLTQNTSYTVTYGNAFSIGGQNYNLKITIQPTVIGTYCKMMITNQKSVWIQAKNSKVKTTYEIINTSTGTTVSNYYFGYGFKDPDGGDYLFNPSGYDIFYVDAPRNAGTQDFTEYYHVHTSGTYMGVSRDTIVNTEYSDAMILVGKTGTSKFEFTLDTTRSESGGSGGTEDFLKLPVVTYKPKEYDISYVLNGGTQGTYHPNHAIYENVIRVSNPQKNGYAFKGWTLQNGNTSTAKYGNTSSNVTTSWSNASTPVSKQYFKNLTATDGGSVTLNAQWEEKTATLTYNANGHGTAPSPVIMKYSTATNAAGKINANGYTFIEWNTNADGTGTSYAAGARVKNANVVPTPMTLYAQWSIHSSSLKVDPNGGTVNVKSPSGASGVNITTSQTYTQNYNTTLTLGTPTKSSSSKTTTYTVTYKGNGGTVATTTNANTKSSRTDTINYQFNNWTESFQFYGMLSNDKKTYTFPADNNVTSTITAKYDSTFLQGMQGAVTLASVNNRTGYNFLGWATDPEGTPIGTAGDSYTPSDNITLYAIWEEKTATLTYNANGHGTAPSAVTMTYTGVTYASGNIVANGYKLTGWNTKADGTGTSYAVGAVVNGANVVPSNITLYAQWTAESQVILTVDPGLGTAIVAGTTISVPTSFTGAQGNQRIIRVNPPPSYVESGENRTMTYDGNGGLVGPLTTDNTNVTTSILYSHAFTRWDRNPFPRPNSGVGTFVQDTALDGWRFTYGTVNETLTAIWTKTVTNMYGKVTLPNASRPGFTLDGWHIDDYIHSLTAGDPGDIYSPGVFTLHAVWTPINYSITYNVDGGVNDGNNPNTYNAANNNITILPPTKEGYQFAGWQKTVSNLGWADGYINQNEGLLTQSSTYTSSHFSGLIALKGGVTYTISGNNGYSPSQIRWKLYSADGTYLGHPYGNITGATCTAPEDCYARILYFDPSTEAQRNGTIITGNIPEDEVIIPTGSTGNITLTANWIQNSSTLVINTAGGEAQIIDNSNTIISAGSETIDSIGSYEGHQNDQLIITNPVKEPIVANTYYTVTYNYNGNGEENSGETVAKTQTTRYEFNRWDNSNLQGTLSNITYSGNSAILYTYGNEHGALDELTAIYTESTENIETPEVVFPTPYWEGHTFLGWYTAASGGTLVGMGNYSYVPTADITLFAHWTLNTVTVTRRVDNNPWTDGNVRVSLYQNDDEKYSMDLNNVSTNGATITWNGVESGTYNLYASKNVNDLTTLAYTGVDIVVTTTGTAAVDYYTLTLTKSVGISAVSGGGTYLKNQTANIDAIVEDGFTWQGWSVVSGNSPD